MLPTRFILLLFLEGVIYSLCSCSTSHSKVEEKEVSIGRVDQNETFLAYEINPKEADIAFYWQNDKGENYRNFSPLKEDLNSKNRELLFAVNGGMFNPLMAPQGLYIEGGDLIAPLDTFSNRTGNFYLLPNGVFSLSNTGVPAIEVSTAFQAKDSITFATQSGPLLLINGDYHPAFRQGSTNVNIRNGVGILPNGNLFFVMSKVAVNFYDFTTFFYEKGCKNALYLDGYISRTYLPQAGYSELDGDFGVMIGITVPSSN